MGIGGRLPLRTPRGAAPRARGGPRTGRLWVGCRRGAARLPLALVALALGACGRPTEAWLRDLQHGDLFQRRLAAMALREASVEEIEAVLPALLRAGIHQDLELRAIARRSLLDLRREGRLGLPALRCVEDLLEAEDPVLRRTAILGAQAIGPGTPEVLDVLERALLDRDALVRADALTALAQLDPKGERSQELLVLSLDDPDLATLAATLLARSWLKHPPPLLDPAVVARVGSLLSTTPDDLETR